MKKCPKVGESVHVFAAGFRCESGLEIAAHQVRGTIKAHHWVRPSEDDWGCPPDDEFETSVSWSLSEWQDQDSFTRDEICGKSFTPDGWAWVLHTAVNW